jgi:Uma2 family endonuclease
MSTISTEQLRPIPFAPPAMLPLEDGDHLSLDEFIRRYDAMLDIKKAELIEGVVRMPPPASDSYHSQPQFNFVGFLGAYSWATPGTRGGDNGSIKLDPNNMPQPDAFLAIEPSCGGRVQIDDKGYVVGSPELIAEIAASSVSYDLHAKKELYRKHGAKEYVVWRVKEQAIDWFILRGEEFEPLPIEAGIFRSQAFPGLWLAAPALIASDFTRVRQILQEGLASPEHRAFLERLEKQRSS